MDMLNNQMVISVRLVRIIVVLTLLDDSKPKKNIKNWFMIVVQFWVK